MLYQEIPQVHLTNNCKICCSLDYEPHNKAVFHRKPKIKVKGEFEISQVPVHLLHAIISKMHYTTFLRFRRTNRHFSEYIESHRASIRIAWFHDKSVKLIKHSRSGKWEDEQLPCIEIYHKHFRTRCRHDSRELERASPNVSKVIKSMTIESITIHLYIFLTDLEENGSLRRELIGSYKPVTIKVGDRLLSLSDTEWKPYCSLFEKFINWTGIKDQCLSFKTLLLPPMRSAQICSMFHAKTVHLNHAYETLQLDNVSFDEAEVVRLGTGTFAEGTLNSFPRVQVLEIYGCCYVSELKLILKTWADGTSTLKQIDIHLIGKLSDFTDVVTEFIADGYAVELDKSEWSIYFVDRLYDFEKIKSVKPYIFQRKSSEKKAVCVLAYNRMHVSMLV